MTIGDPEVFVPASLVRQVGWTQDDALEALVTDEWLVTNGIGGYASGTVGGVATRRFHGCLIAALPTPLGRTMMLNHLEEHATLAGGERLRLAGDERHGKDVLLPDPKLIEQFRLEHGLPLWRYASKGFTLEKRVLMPHHQNSTYLIYQLSADSQEVKLELVPSLHFRPHEGLVSAPADRCTIRGDEESWEIASSTEFPPLRLWVDGARARLLVDEGMREHLIYRLERDRGYESEGSLWSPGVIEMLLKPGETAALVISTETWEAMRALPFRVALEAEYKRRNRLLTLAAVGTNSPIEAQLVLAADQFIITPQMREADSARSRASGDDPRTVIAGYHWFTDWGRDTMISLEGLTLSTGRQLEGGNILRTFAHYVRDGLIPNMFPEGKNEGLYHTADATLWFFHALDRYVTATNDRTTLKTLIPTLQDIIAHHIRGTRFGIAVDPEDGLLRQGAEGYQLTWMDAKVGDWVVTPRRGKAVEINALFYNAMRLLEHWLREDSRDEEANELAAHAERAYQSFNRRFWYEEGQYLYDVIDGENGSDFAFRPNQIFSISLPHAILTQERWKRIVDAVAEQLVTPLGLRSLAPGHADYKSRYDGDLRARDAAYHQGTVWGWLIGPFIDAWLKVHPGELRDARSFLQGFESHLRDAGVGTISEVFDAEAPYTARGCMAQAWSVAEVLRCWKKTEGSPPIPSS